MKHQFPIEDVDFFNTNYAIRQINQWAKQKTRGHISGIVSDDLSKDTAILLLNAMYFKGSWRYRFNETDTDLNGQFEVTTGRTIAVQMMAQSNNLNHGDIIFNKAQQLGLRWVELPYEGNELAIIVMLPTVHHQLDEMLKQLTLDSLQKMFSTIEQNYNPNEVHLKLPKFSIKSTVALNEPLKMLSVKRIFGSDSHPSRMTTIPTRVDDVKQELSFSVDENGSIGTAVSKITVFPLSAKPFPDIHFTCNQPFAVFVVDKVNRIPLFVARIRLPSTS
ncbi:antichymotrypsin-2-like [Sabethes cyaneus]|uniref:antichymotrypsin-2-like n=1 Tax=Sabethes cyaneus TaxID=53552 RepID=UPI00237D90A3|nr:antichymotrypsin-2-like [Sabethes cyaneus]